MSFKPEDSTDHESDSDSEVPKLSPVKVRFGIPLQAQDAELGTESFVSLDGQILILKRPEEITTSVLPAEDPPTPFAHPVFKILFKMHQKEPEDSTPGISGIMTEVPVFKRWSTLREYEARGCASTLGEYEAAGLAHTDSQ